MQTKALARYILPTLFAAAMLLTQNAHAGWIMEWIECSENCGWVCDCDGSDYLAFKPQNPQEKKAAEEIIKVMGSFKSNIRSLSPDAKNLLKKAGRNGKQPTLAPLKPPVPNPTNPNDVKTLKPCPDGEKPPCGDRTSPIPLKNK